MHTGQEVCSCPRLSDCCGAPERGLSYPAADYEPKTSSPDSRGGRSSSGVFTVGGTPWPQRELSLSWSHRHLGEVYTECIWKVVHPQGIWNWRKPQSIQELEAECALRWMAPENLDSGTLMTKCYNQGFSATSHQLQALAEFPENHHDSPCPGRNAYIITNIPCGCYICWLTLQLNPPSA